MKTFKNEEGYALLMVLMLIILFTVLGMGLMATNMNSAAQFNTKEQQVQARHQAEMGVLHYVTQAEELLEERNQSITNSPANAANADIIFCSSLNEVVENTDDTYEVNIVNPLSGSCLDGDNLEIKIKSTGKAIDENATAGAISKEVLADFTINKKTPSDTVEETQQDGEESNESVDSTIDYKVIQGDSFITNSEDLTSTRSLHYKGNLGTKNGNDNDGATIIIEENLKIDGTFEAGSQGCLAVGNDLILNGSSEIKNKFYVYVYGDLYLKNGVNLKGQGEIFVNGDVYVGENRIKQNPKQYSSFIEDISLNNKHDDCVLPWNDKPIYDLPLWEFLDEIETEYK